MSELSAICLTNTFVSIGSLNVIYRGCDDIRVVNATELGQWPQCTINYLNAEKWLLEKTTSSETYC